MMWFAIAVIAWRGFSAPQPHPSTANIAVLARDLNGDARPEVVVSGNQVDEYANFSMFVNRGDGTFADERLIPSAFGEKIEDAADIDHDGFTDLLASNYWANGISTYAGDASLSFARHALYGTATHGGPSRLIDVDNDGTLDVISLSFGSGNPVRVHRFAAHPDGSLGAKTTFDTNLAVGSSLSTRRMNGVLELLVSEHSGNLGLIRVTATGVDVSRLPAGPGFDSGCVFADVNGDGIADVIDVADEAGALEPVFVTLGAADGTFGERRRIGGERHLQLPVKVRSGDVDGDGAADLLVHDFRIPTLFLFLGDGHGQFAGPPIAIDAGAPINDFDLADLNGDGAVDLVTANTDHTISVLLNLGRGERRRTARH